MSDTEEDSKDKSKRPLEVSSEGNDEVEEKRSSRKRGKNLKIFRPYFAFQVMHYIRECAPPPPILADALTLFHGQILPTLYYWHPRFFFILVGIVQSNENSNKKIGFV